MSLIRAAVFLTLSAVALARPVAAQSAPVVAATFSPALSVPAVAAALPVGGIFSEIFGLSVGLDDLEEHVRDTSVGFGEDFKRWGNTLYASLFLLQFLLIGATMVIRGPFALTSQRPVSALGPFANFFFFLVAGAFGYLLVSNSYYPVSGADGVRAGGWLPWFFDVFTEAGKATGCDNSGSVLGVNPCDSDMLAAIGMKMSGIIQAISPSSGNSSDSTVNRVFSAAGASSGVFSAFSVLAIQMSITRIAFQIAIVTAPFFLATLIFRPISGISTGFISFVVYLGVKLFVLYLVAGLASYLAAEWIEATILMVTMAAATGLPVVGGAIGMASKIFSFNMSVLTMSLLFLGLTLYLPTKIASAVSGAFHLDLNGLLFRGELPIQMD